jgi:hypothetical protein
MAGWSQAVLPEDVASPREPEAHVGADTPLQVHSK